MANVNSVVVRVSNFSFSYQRTDGSLQPVLQNVSLELEPGSFCVVVGATGCGKSTFLLSLKPELMPSGVASGSIAVGGTTLIHEGVRAVVPQEFSAQTIGLVLQDPAAQIVCDTVLQELAFGLENLGMSQNEMRRRVAEVAHFFGIEPWIHLSCEELSGGQKQIVNLAAVLALRPQVLLLDEPTAHLDPYATRQFLNMLSQVNRELGITVVMATHKPEEVEPYVTDYLELGKTAEIAERGALQSELERRNCERERAYLDNSHVVEVRNLYVRYECERPWVLRGVNLTIRQGVIHALVGGNGCGKTTLLKTVAGILKAQRGSARRAQDCSQAYLPQDPKTLFVCDTVVEELAEWRDVYGYEECDEELWLNRFGLAEYTELHPYDLSGGQQQKLALAKLLLTGAELLLLDEPSKGLDADSCAELIRLLQELVAEGRTVVLVSHDLAFVSVVADRVSMLFDGEIACTESAKDFFAHNVVYCPPVRSQLYGMLRQR